jgi:hypothetical protein
MLHWLTLVLNQRLGIRPLGINVQRRSTNDAPAS